MSLLCLGPFVLSFYLFSFVNDTLLMISLCFVLWMAQPVMVENGQKTAWFIHGYKGSGEKDGGKDVRRNRTLSRDECVEHGAGGVLRPVWMKKRRRLRLSILLSKTCRTPILPIHIVLYSYLSFSSLHGPCGLISNVSIAVTPRICVHRK